MNHRAAGVVLALAAAVVAVAAPRLAQACDCGTPEPTVAQAQTRLATIVHGRVVAARDRPGSHEIDVLVARAWKGATAGTTVTIPVEASSCGYFLVPGDEVLLYAPATGAVAQCAGDRTARVITDAGMIAADAVVLGAPTSEVALPARSPGPAADVVIVGRVTQALPGYRSSFRVRVDQARVGATRRQSLDVYSALGCPVAAPAVGARVEVRATRVRGQLVVASCLDGLGVTVRAQPRRRP